MLDNGKINSPTEKEKYFLTMDHIFKVILIEEKHNAKMAYSFIQMVHIIEGRSKGLK